MPAPNAEWRTLVRHPFSTIRILRITHPTRTTRGNRNTNGNTNGLIRQYLPKGKDLGTLSKGRRYSIAKKLNDRPSKRHGYRTPVEVIMERT